MNRITSLKSVAAAAIVLGAFGAATAAHARSDVAFSVGVQVPGAYVQAASPAYVQPQPVFVQPQFGAVFGQRDWNRNSPYGDRDHDGIANVYDRDDYRHHNRHVNLRGPWGDFDHDGVPNRFDRAPGNPYRR